MKTGHILKFATYISLIAAFSACSTIMLPNTQPQESTQKQSFTEQLGDIQITEEAAELLITETYEIIIREKLVCRNEAKLGTRFKTDICRTQTELDAMRKNAKRETINAQRTNSMDNK